jgi:hypothetical protein
MIAITRVLPAAVLVLLLSVDVARAQPVEPRIELHSMYAEKTYRLTTPDFTSCDCPAGRFCAWGRKSVNEPVAVQIEGRTAAVEVDPRNADDAMNAAPDPTVARCDVQFPLWFISVSTVEVPEGSIVTASFADLEKHPTVVLRTTHTTQISEFTIDGTLVVRGPSANGNVGPGIGIASMTRARTAPNIAGGPLQNPGSPWSFGVRYDAAIFSQDSLHRLAVLGDFDIKRWTDVGLTVGIALGGAVSAQTAGGNALNAGFLAGLSFQVDWRVAGQVSGVVGLLGQGIFTNAGTTLLGSMTFGPQVTF